MHQEGPSVISIALARTYAVHLRTQSAPSDPSANFGMEVLGQREVGSCLSTRFSVI